MADRKQGTIRLVDSYAPPRLPPPEKVVPGRQRLMKAATSGSARELVSALASLANNLGVSCVLHRRISELEPVIDRQLAQAPSGHGALVSVEYYVHSEGQVVLGPVRLLAFAADPNGAYRQSVDAPGMSPAPPEHLLLDRKRGQFLWYTRSPTLRYEVIAHPYTELLRQGRLTGR